MERDRRQQTDWRQMLWMAGSVCSIINTVLLAVIVIAAISLSVAISGFTREAKRVATVIQKAETVKDAAVIVKDAAGTSLDYYRKYKAKKAAAKNAE